MKEKFLYAIDNKLKISVTFNSKKKGQITRECIPFDFGASKKIDAIDKTEKYHVYDLSSPSGKIHPIPINPENMLSIELLNENFNPDDYVTWTPINWIYSRDWGNKS
jgi:hypothetical protein